MTLPLARVVRRRGSLRTDERSGEAPRPVPVHERNSSKSLRRRLSASARGPADIPDGNALDETQSGSHHLHHRRYSRWKCTRRNTIGLVSLLLAAISFISHSKCTVKYCDDIPYWTGYGIRYHRDHFRWSSSLEGDYCIDPSFDPSEVTQKGVNPWKLSHNNGESPLTRVLLLSYPRSGNHLTQAMLQCLLQTEIYSYPQENNDGPAQIMAIHQADAERPYVRKIHSVEAIPPEFAQYQDGPGLGLIYLVRDPAESILSESKFVPYWWKHYEHEFGSTFLKLPAFYHQWQSDASKLLLFYEDFFDAEDPYINLRKMAAFFGEKRVSKERLDQCIDRYKEVSNRGLNSLDRKQASDHNVHHYKELYHGKDPMDWPEMRVSQELYDTVFHRYETFQSCS